ncbi:hypothetical protein [Hyphomicrobium sp. D-2]|uniref:hypothetical protein n=1 Tax=Hyphomicrobium sp. D-2 TaxID=3041621 RepID=UPI0024564170|nr:hypothetical protein [Hyphomicrobium sp. D-2]MDH4982035.1 hypothetical protein [Hyphomicrobium sp. D-2]
MLTLFAVLQASDAQAQRVVANGIALTATGNYNTSANYDAGIALWALNGGSIVTTGAITVTTSGINGHGAEAELNGTITINQPGSTITTSGSGGYGLVTDGGQIFADSLAIRIEGTGSFGAIASGTGSFISLTNTEITTTNGSEGIRAVAGGEITVENVIIHTAGASAYGIVGNDGRVTIGTGVEVYTQGAGAIGLFALGGQLETQAVTVNTEGTGAYGVMANFSGGLVSLGDGSSITTQSDNAHGLYAIQRGEINTGAVSVTTNGNSAHGAYSNGVGSLVTIDAGSTIETLGATAHGLFAGDTGAVSASGASVTTAGGGSHGLYALSGGQVTAGGVSVSTGGDSSYGALASGAISLVSIGSGSQITTAGVGAIGLSAQDGGEINAQNATVTTSGANAAAIGINGGSSISISNSTVTALGSGSAGVSSVSGNNGVTITGSSVNAADGAGFDIADGQLSATLTNATVSGGDELLNVSSTGVLDIYAARSTLTGRTVTAAGGTAQLNLLGASVWNITGDSNLTLLINQAGSLAQFTPPGSSAGPFKTLTVNDYLGLGGTLGINTHLGADGSPSDRLIIDGGNGLGSSLLSVNNVGGGGDLTTLDGILVVDTINSATAPGLFTLAAPVIAGPYEYSLYRGGENGANPDNWYLRSDLDCALIRLQRFVTVAAAMMHPRLAAGNVALRRCSGDDAAVWPLDARHAA